MNSGASLLKNIKYKIINVQNKYYKNAGNLVIQVNLTEEVYKGLLKTKLLPITLCGGGRLCGTK